MFTNGLKKHAAIGALMASARPMFAGAAKHFGSKAAVRGAALGAGSGAISGALEKDETGKRKGLGGALKGAVGGAVSGGVGGAIYNRVVHGPANAGFGKNVGSRRPMRTVGPSQLSSPQLQLAAPAARKNA